MKLWINAVSCKAGGGLTDLMHTLPLLERQMQSRGWSVHSWVVPAGAEALRRDGHTLKNIGIVQADSPLARAGWELYRLPRLVRRENPSAVFQFSNLIFRGLSVPQVTVLRSPTFFSSDYGAKQRRGMYQRARYAIGCSVSRKTIERAGAVFCISQTQKDDITRACGEMAQKVRVAHLGVSVPAESRHGERPDRSGAMESLPPDVRQVVARTLQPGCQVLLNVAHYYQHKNLLTLLLAVDALSQSNPRIRLILTAGVVDYTGPCGANERQEIALVQDLARRGILADLGPVTKDCVWPLLQMADVFVFPSSLESFGHPLLEALGAGTPVVASDTPIHREIAGSAAIYHSVFDPSSLAAGVRSVLDDAGLRSRLAAAGQNVIARFSWEAHVEKLIDAIIHVAAAPQGNGRLAIGGA